MQPYFSHTILYAFVFLLSQSGVVRWMGPTTYDMGSLQREKPARHAFAFQNISGDTLRIDNVRTSCGCTVPDWSLAPIPPDSTGQISIEYDADDKGHFRKKIKVYFDQQRRAEVLWIEGQVQED